MKNNFKLIIWLIVVALLILHSAKILFFNQVHGDDATFISYAMNMLKGRMAVDTYADFVGIDQYYFFYPPLFAMFVASIFKILGTGYETAKIVSVLFSILSVVLIYTFSKKRLGRQLALLVTLLLAFDPLYFSVATRCRPEAMLIFFFTASVLVYILAEERHSFSLTGLAGLLAGLTLLTSLNGVWIIIAFLTYQIVSKKLFKSFKRQGVYLLAVFLVVLPYFLWIILSPERMAIFSDQVCIGSAALQWTSLVGKNLLNPIADLYLMMFRAYSLYPLILLIALLFLLLNVSKQKYLLCVLLVPLFMTVLTHRTARYLLTTMPVCYLCFGYAYKSFLLEAKGFLWARRKNVIVALCILVLSVNIGLATKSTFTAPDLTLNISYYREVFSKYTKENSRIVTDHALLLSASGGRKIFSLGPLVWDRWRKMYSYDEIVRRLDPDYIVLTERKKSWSDTDHPQNRAFQQLLKTDFELIQELSHSRYGRLWIYQRQG